MKERDLVRIILYLCVSGNTFFLFSPYLPIPLFPQTGITQKDSLLMATRIS